MYSFKILLLLLLVHLNFSSKIRLKRANDDDRIGSDIKYGASGVKSSLHGTIFQLKLLMLFVNRGVNKDYDFRLATEMNDAEKFDDVVFRNIKKNEYIFLQAKHKEPANKEIHEGDLLSVNTDSMFNLQKYFNSYSKIVRNDAFKNGDIKELLIATNIGLSDELKKDFQEFNPDKEHMLFLDSKKAKFYKLKDGYSFQDNLEANLYDTSERHQLMKALYTCIVEGKQISLTNELFKKYNVLLKDLKIIDTEQFELHDDFVTNSMLLPDAVEFRTDFAKYVKEQSPSINLANSNTLDALRTKYPGLKISKTFGSKPPNDPPKSLPGDKITKPEIDSFYKKLTFAVNLPNEMELDDVIKQDMKNVYDAVQQRNMFNALHIKMLNWLKERGGSFITRDSALKSFEQMRKEVFHPIYFNIVQEKINFVERPEELREITNGIEGNKYVVITGLGGTGKTQMASRFVRAHKEKEGGNIIWLNARDELSLRDSLIQLANKPTCQIPIDNLKKTEEIMKKVFEFFGNSQALFVFDDVKNYKNLEPFIRGISTPVMPKILITSQFKNWNEDAFTIIKLGGLKPVEAHQFIKKNVKNEGDPAVESLASKLKNFPLALQQAVSYINEQKLDDDYTISDYLEQFQKTNKELLEFRGSGDPSDLYTETILTTWQMAVEAIQKNPTSGHDAHSLLNMMAYLQSSKVPIALFLEKGTKTEAMLKKEIRLLNEYSLIDKHEKFQAISMHELVQIATRINLKDANLEEKTLRDLLELIDYKNENYLECSKSALEFANEYENLKRDFSKTRHYTDVQLYFKELEYAKAVGVCNEVLNMKDRYPLNDLAEFACYQSQALKAVNMPEEALVPLENVNNLLKAQHAPPSESILKLKFELATLYLNNKNAQAQELFREITGMETKFGTIKDVTVLREIAFSHVKLGNFQKAQELYDVCEKLIDEKYKYLNKDEKVYIPDFIDPNANINEVKDSKNYYSGVWYVWKQKADLHEAQGQFQDAIEGYEKIYNELQDVVGYDAPITSKILEKLSKLCLNQGDTDKSVKYLKILYKIQREQLGPTNLITEKTRANLNKLSGKISRDHDLDLLENPSKCARLSRRKRNAEGCLFNRKDIEEFIAGRKDEKVLKIDGEKFLEFIKKNPNEKMNSQLMQLVKSNHDIINVHDNYKFMVENVIDFHGFENMAVTKRMDHLVGERSNLAVRPTWKTKLMHVPGRVMLMHGIYGTLVTCSRGVLTTNCALGSGGIGWSFVSAPIERVIVTKLTPKLVKFTMTATEVLGKVIPAETRFVVRLVGAKAAASLLRGAGAAIGGVFDIVDIGFQAHNLVECNEKKNTDKPCSEREVRDSIVSMSIDGISFVAGIALAAVGAPGVGLIVAGTLFAIQILYNGISATLDYHQKYHTTFGEDTSTFFRSLVFKGPSLEVIDLIDRTELIKFRSKAMWSALENYPNNVVAYGSGIGLIDGDRQLKDGADIFLDRRDLKFTTVSRVIPENIPVNGEMICLPTFTNDLYEKGITSYVPTSVFFCDNAMVFANNSRKNADTVVLNLEFIDSGNVRGSHEWNNVFIVNDTEPEKFSVTGGSSVSNRFIFSIYPFATVIEGGANSTNILDFSQSDLDPKEKTRKFQFEYASGKFKILTTHPKAKNTHREFLNTLDKFNPKTDNRSYHFIGREKTSEEIHCYIYDSHNPLMVDSRGGYKGPAYPTDNIDGYDSLIDCKKVILSPFSQVYSASLSEDNFTIYVRTNEYTGKDLISRVSLAHGIASYIFSEFELVNNDTKMVYKPLNKELHVIMYFGENQYTLIIENFVEKTPVYMYNKHGDLIIPRIQKSNEETVVKSFEMQVLCPTESMQTTINYGGDKCTDKTRTSPDLKVLTTVKFGEFDYHYIIGSDDRDVIYFDNEFMLAKGRNGHDVYMITDKQGFQKRGLVIFNHASDKLLDSLMMPEVPKEYTVSEKNLLLQFGVTTITIFNYFNSIDDQHLIFINRSENMEAFIPLKTKRRFARFIQATDVRNVFTLHSDFSETDIVIDALPSELEIYRNDYNLLILQTKTSNQLVVSIENFYLNLEKWVNVNWFFYNNGNLAQNYDFIFFNSKVKQYKTKIKEDYQESFKEYITDFSVSSVIEHNQANYVQNRVGILIINSVLPKNIQLKGQGKSLILRDRRSGNEVEIRNWESDITYRISIVVFTKPLESITIHGLDHFSLNSRYQMENLFEIAAKNYEKQQIYSPLTSTGVKCIISIDGFDHENSTYTCLGMSSMSEQSRFVEKFCQVETLQRFKTNATREQVRAFIVKLQNDMSLNSYNRTEKDYCQRYFDSVFASEYSPVQNNVPKEEINLAEELFKTSTWSSLQKVKDLVAKGADLYSLSKDSFKRSTLHMAVLTSKIEFVKYIVERKVNVNLVDKNGDTALNYVFNAMNNICVIEDEGSTICNEESEMAKWYPIGEYLLSNSAKAGKTPRVPSIRYKLHWIKANYPKFFAFVQNLLFDEYER